MLALRGSDGFSRDRGRVPGVNPPSLGARSCCKNRYLVTLTFAPLEPKGWSRAQIHKNSMLFDSLLLRHLSCLNRRHLSCLNNRFSASQAKPRPDICLGPVGSRQGSSGIRMGPYLSRTLIRVHRVIRQGPSGPVGTYPPHRPKFGQVQKHQIWSEMGLE